MDTHYDVFIAGILPEKKHQTEQVEAAFLAHYAGRYHLYKKAQQQPGEYCFAKNVSLDQAQEFQKKLLQIGLLSRYRPAINHNLDFELEPLPEQTITCPFCQNTQKKPEKLTRQRCENCNAKMSLFEKYWRVHKQTKQSPRKPIHAAKASAVASETPAVSQVIEQTQQKHQITQHQTYFYNCLILFTITSILAITGFALYQSGIKPESEARVEIPPPAQTEPATANPVASEPSTILKQGLNPNVLSKLSADQLLKTAAQIKPTAKIPDMDEINLNGLNNSQLEASLNQLQQPTPAIDSDNLAQHIAALDNNTKNALTQTEAQQIIEQVKHASPEQRHRLRKQLEQNLPVTADNENAADIFAPLYAMEKFQHANKQQQQRLKKLYRSYLQDKQIAERLKHLSIKLSPDPFPNKLPQKTHPPTLLTKKLTRWLHPGLADILLNQHFSPINES